MNFENRQSQHYDEIIQDYDAHYNEKYSNKYRKKFLYNPLFADIDWTNKKVLEGMCGTGSTTGYLLDRGAEVTGLDVSNKAIELFKTKWPKAKAICASMTASNLPNDSFDVVVINGGLHHLHPNLDKAIEEIYRILKPNGLFFFLEPHSASFFDRLRKFWYKFDKLFEDNEAAINLDEMKQNFQNKFNFKKEIYVGGPAYILVFSSMVFRISPKIKFLYSDILIFIDQLIRPMVNKYNSFNVLVCWQKK